MVYYPILPKQCFCTTLQNKHTMACFHSMSYDYFIENFKNTLSINCNLSTVSFRCLNSLQRMFEVSSLRANSNTRLQTLSPLADSSVNSAADRSKRQQVAAWVRRHCGSASRTHAAASSHKSCNQRGSGPDCGVIALEKSNQLFHAAGVRLCHAPDAQVQLCFNVLQGSIEHC